MLDINNFVNSFFYRLDYLKVFVYNKIAGVGMNKIKNTAEWFKLDNASKIYPASGNTRWNAVYRVCAVMKERVDREVLQQA